MLLIGRAYAATAERGRSGGSTAESSGDEFYIRGLPRALRMSAIDARLRALRGLRMITEQNAPKVVQTHSVLMAVLRDLTGLEKQHFHRSIFISIFHLSFSYSTVERNG